MAKRNDPPAPSPDGLKQSLGRALDHHHRRRRIVQPSKAEKAQRTRDKRDPKTVVSEAIRHSDPRAVGMLVTPEAQRHGDYRVVDFKLQEVVEGGKVKTKTSKAVRNLASTVVERWNARGVFEERQWQAIIKYISLHCAAFGPGQRVTANYSPIIRGGGSAEDVCNRVADAMKILRLLDNEVFFREPAEHFWIWQNVLIFDEPAGVAGSRCGYSHKGAEAVAREIVRSIAGKVAELLVDQPLPRDFRSMLLDLDAPRRPGRRVA